MQITLATQFSQPENAIIPVVQSDSLADRLAGLSQRLNVPADVLQRDFSADSKDVLPLYGVDGHRTYLLGIGCEPKVTDWLKAFRLLFFKQKERLSRQVTVDLTGFSADVVEAVVLGIRTGGYDLRLYQTGKEEKITIFSDGGHVLIVVGADQQMAAHEALGRAEALAGTQRAMLNLMNAPANYKTPQTLADWVTASGKQYGYRVTVLDKAALEEQGLGALLSVGQGSVVPPVLIVMEYKPEGETDLPKVGLVGKGVTFDTGGLSIKPSTNMHLMKSDMGGAAAVMGTLEVAAKLKLPVHLIGIVPATENSVDAQSTRPGDVITSYSGKTIEIIDTDAEGRVILADGLAYMTRHFQPDVLIDLATLTGSVIAALGYHAAGLFTPNDALACQLLEAGSETGERLWRMPVWDVYNEDIKSDVADVKNFSGKPVAGSISAAKFLEYFTDKHPAWAHLDIAGMAFADNEFGSQKNATGFGIRLLIQYLRTISSKSR
jgi:leucyl aminopeptidase